MQRLHAKICIAYYAIALLALPIKREVVRVMFEGLNPKPASAESEQPGLSQASSSAASTSETDETQSSQPNEGERPMTALEKKRLQDFLDGLIFSI